MSRTRAALTALSLLPALLLAGCSDDDPEPKFGPTPTPSSVVSSSPSASVAPALGPEETVRAWVDAQNTALATGDTSGMEALSAADCRGCADFTGPIERVFRAGGSFDTPGWKIEGSHLRSSEGPPVIDLAVTIAGGKTTAKAGAEPIVFAPEKELLVLKLTADGDSWAITFIGFVT